MQVDVSATRGPLQLSATLRHGGGVLGLVGPSGGGKTTLLHAIAGLLRGCRGRIELGGRVVLDSARGVDEPAHRRGVAVVFQDNRLLPHRSVAGNLRYAWRRRWRGRDGAGPAWDDVVELLQLTDLLPRPVQTLSGGQAKRVAVARALLQWPAVVLLDEPLSGLDAEARGRTLEVLDEALRQTNASAVLVSHQVEDVLHLTDAVALMAGGQVGAAGRYFDLVYDPAALPALDAAGLMNVLPLTVAGHEPDEGVTLLRGRGDGSASGVGRCVAVKAPHQPGLAVGEAVHAMLRPGEVALAMAPVETVTMQNQLRGRIVGLTERAGRVICVVDAGVTVLAEVTPRAQRQFGLKVGVVTWCLFKTAGLRVQRCSAGAAAERASFRHRGGSASATSLRMRCLTPAV